MIRGIESERGGGAGVCGVLAVPTDRGRVFQWNAQCEIKKCTKNQKPKTCFTAHSSHSATATKSHISYTEHSATHSNLEPNTQSKPARGEGT